MPSSRSVFLFGFLFCAAMIGVALYFQLIEHLEPCPLCILQRVAVAGVGIVMLLAVLHNPRSLGVRIYGAIATVISLIGAVISARHVWLQNLPADQVPSCSPGLNFILDNFPLGEAFDMVMRGSGECADVLWTFLGLSIPAWTLVAFVLLAIAALWQLFKPSSAHDGLGHIKFYSAQ